MATEPAHINLDDIFAGIPSLETSTNVVVEHRESVHYRTGSIQRSNTHHSTASHPTSHVSNQHVPVSDVYIPPEPKSRASTAQSASRSQVSQAKSNTSVSTVKHEPHYIPVSHAMAQPVPAPREPSHPPSEDLMSSIFEAVSLPPVESHTSSVHHSHHQHHDHEHAIQSIDDALHGEESDAYSVVSDRSSHRYAAYNNGAHQVAETVVTDSFNALNLNGGHNGYHSSSEYYNEDHDKFEPAHMPYQTSREQGHRPRTMTVDSLASVAETRYGGFDVHDDNGHYTSQEIDLHHNEVAYKRPKKVPAAKVPLPSVATQPIHTGGTIHLQQMNKELADANRMVQQLQSQIERQQIDNERQRQRNLAAEAKIKVGQRYPQPPSSVTSKVTSHTPKSYHSSSAVHSHNTHSTGHHNGHHGHSGQNSRTSSVTTTTVTPANLVSQTSIYEEEPVTVSEVAQHQISHGQQLGRVGKYNLIQPLLEEVQGFSKNPHIHKVVIGGHSLPTEDDKCVLLFGPVGSGKTSAITSMLNYLYDVKKENNFRFVLEHDHKHTTGLTAYVINNSILPYSVTIVDTPGVVDEKNNKTVSTLIKQWFEQELFDAGAFRIDAISIVLKHDEDNLGWPFIYELAAVKRMFGDDLKTNVLPIITHTEVLPQPLAIRSLALANIAFVEYYKVNNIGFAPEAKGISKLQHNLYFTHGLASLELYFKGLQELIHPLLAVLRSPAGIRSAQSHSYDGTALY